MIKKFIIVGPTASGKDHLKQTFRNKGLNIDVSYTTRPPREGETNGLEYHFISEEEFFDEGTNFYEYVKFGDYYYGTGQIEWDSCDVFIMEASAVKAISQKERKKCLVYYLNPSKEDRFERLFTNGRGWDYGEISDRFEVDDENFKDFIDFDIEIKNSDF